MPRKASWPPKITHHKASGRDRLRWRNVDYYLGPHDSPESRREYARLLVELSEKRQQETPATPADAITVAEVVARWHVHARQHYSAEGREMEGHDTASRVLLAEAADAPAKEFDCDRLEAVRARMARKGWCRNRINRMVGRIRTMWRWAERKKLVPPGSWGHLRTLAALRPLTPGVKESKPVKPCSKEDLERVAAKTARVPGAILLLCWETGARPGEFRALDVGEVDRSGEAWVCRPGKHKNAWRGQGRAVVLTRRAQEIIEPFLAGKGPADPVFPSPRTGGYYQRHSLVDAVRVAALRAGVKLHCYQCRHAVKKRVKREHGLDAARSVLGQKSILTTDRYDEGVDEEEARRVIREMDRPPGD